MISNFKKTIGNGEEEDKSKGQRKKALVSAREGSRLKKSQKRGGRGKDWALPPLEGVEEEGRRDGRYETIQREKGVRSGFVSCCRRDHGYKNFKTVKKKRANSCDMGRAREAQF